jgi:ABC-2 type transport system permease protein
MSIFAQLKREFTAFFYSPIAYVLLTAAAVLNGVVFLLVIDFLSDPRAPQGAAMQMLFGGTIFFWIIVIVLTPLITMRTLAEERHSGTLETLLTAPISDMQVVVAKYLAAVGFYIVLWLPTLAYPLLLSSYSDLDLGPILSGYLGTLGVGMMFTAVGMLGSSLTRNQIIAALISFGAIMMMFVIGIFDFLGGETSPDSVLHYVNLWTHMEDFGRGIVDTRHLAYYGSVSLLALFCTVQVVQLRRWRG